MLRMRNSLGATWILLLVIIGLDVGCKKTEPLSNTEAPHWVSQATPHRKVAVVFIHGLFGGTTATWSDDKGHSLFKFLAEDEAVGDKVDIFAFGFTSNMFKGGSLDIIEAANRLDEWMENKDVWGYQDVVFVAHSMGGLVAMREVLNHRERMDQIPLLVLYATPQEGSQVTNIAKVVANNPALEEMLPGDNSQFLKELDDSWRRLPAKDRPTVVCAYETMPTHGVKIVSRISSTRYCDGPPLAIGGADHITLVKPDSADHDAVIKLVNALKKYVFGSPREPMLAMPDFTREADHLLFEINDVLSPATAALVNQGPRKIRYSLSQPSNPKLLVDPSESPRTLSAGERIELKFNLLLRGRLDPEYRFRLSSGAGSEETLVVRITDPAAAHAQEVALMDAVRESVDTFLSEPGNSARLQALPEDELRLEVATVAREALIRKAPGLSPGVSWVLAADALSNVGWPDLATVALRKAEIESPTTTHSPSVQLLASVISAQSGEAQVLRHRIAIPTPQAADLARFTADTDFISNRNAQSWKDLSTQMQALPGLEQEAKVLQGDVLKQLGDPEAAKVKYIEASQVRTTPAVEARIRSVRVMGGG